MLITPEYQKLQAEFHITRPDYGMSAARHADLILSLAQKMGTRDILDYGCGKATLQKSIPYPIRNYDPCMPEYERRPILADIVVCTDVLEHIEPACLSAVLLDLHALTKQVIFLNVATGPAIKILPDGRNAHLIQAAPEWWLTHLFAHFDLTSFQIGKGEFTCLMAPKPALGAAA